MINYWQNFEHSSFYHIYNHSGSRKNIFREQNDYFQFLIGMEKYLRNYMNIYAYCLMPNHFHVLVSIKSKEEIDTDFGMLDSNAKRKYLDGEIDINKLLEDQFRRWFSSYALKYNNKYRIEDSCFSKDSNELVFVQNSNLSICYAIFTTTPSITYVSLITRAGNIRVIILM